MGVERRGEVIQLKLALAPARERGKTNGGETKGIGISKRMVWEAYKQVKRKKGAGGIDKQSIGDFEVYLRPNLYVLWNRLTSGSYRAPNVLKVEISKSDGGIRTLGVPTVSDRIAQQVVKNLIEPKLEAAREDRKGEVESTPGKGTPQGGVISPLLANLYLHYVLDKWLEFKYPGVKFVRYADDVIVHCDTKAEAEQILQSRFDFLGYSFKLRTTARKSGGLFQGYDCEISQKSEKKIIGEMRASSFQTWTGSELTRIIEHFNPKISRLDKLLWEI